MTQIMKGNKENDEINPQSLEKLRERILVIERKLAKYGFDPRRGIESYRIRELKKIISSSSNECEVRTQLVKLIKLQEKFYEILYKLGGLKKMHIDTDTPESRLLTIKEWLIKSNTTTLTTPKRSKFEDALDLIVNTLTICNDACNNDCFKKMLSSLDKVYKRDYDKHRVLEYILKLCVDAHIISKEEILGMESKSIPELIKKILDCATKVGKENLAKIIKVRGMKR